MRSLPLVTVIVPVYKTEPFIRRCIDSVINQTYINLEIILVDDGSPDKCPQICDEYSAMDDRIKVIHKENSGLGCARNTALDIAAGEYIVFLDSDDFISENYVEVMYDILVKTDCGIVQCGLEKGTSDHFTHTNKKNKITIMSGREAVAGYVYKVSACAKLYKNEVIGSIRFPDKINEDEAVYYKIAYGCDAIAIIDKKMYYYYQSPNSITRNENKKIDFTFADIFIERIDYFKVRDPYLTKKSYARYAVSIIMNHSSSYRKKSGQDTRNELINMFRKIYPELKRSGYLGFKEKIVIYLYRAFPNMTARTVGLLKTL